MLSLDDHTAATPSTAPGLVPLGTTPRPAPPAPVRAGSVSDAKRLRSHLQQQLAGLSDAGLRLDSLVTQARSKAIWLMLQGPDGAYFSSWERFCIERQPWGLGIPAGAIELVIKERSDPRAQARRVLREDLPPRLQLGQRGHRRAAVDPALTGSKGPKPGTGKDYLLSRLKRDAPQTLEALAQGQFKSVLQAAQAAGFASKIIQVRASAEALARAAMTHLDGSQVAQLVTYLQYPSTIPSSQARPHGGRRPPSPTRPASQAVPTPRSDAA